MRNTVQAMVLGFMVAASWEAAAAPPTPVVVPVPNHALQAERATDAAVQSEILRKQADKAEQQKTGAEDDQPDVPDNGGRKR